MISGYNSVWRAMGQGPVGLGSDANGMEKLPRATPGPDSAAFYAGLPEQVTGSRVWDYTRDGVAHYGLMRESPRARGTVCGFLREFLCGLAGEELRSFLDGAIVPRVWHGNPPGLDVGDFLLPLQFGPVVRHVSPLRQTAPSWRSGPR